MEDLIDLTTLIGPQKNKAGQPIPRIKTICGLATTRDGFGEPQGQRPRVKTTGASPHVSEA